MAADFSSKEIDTLLVKCHRRCCICHRFCGVKLEIDHIVPRREEGSGDIDNAIPVCFECHAEIHSYNINHPRGRKFRPEELKKHRDQWIEICQKRPEVFREVARDSDVGPLQALIDELDFNLHIAQHCDKSNLGCLFVDEQFRRAIREGVISILHDELKAYILESYRATNRANQAIPPVFSTDSGMVRPGLEGRAIEAITTALPSVEKARNALLLFLSSENES